MLSNLLKDANSGRASCRSSRTRRARSAWTNLFRQVGIYSPLGQLYEPEDMGSMLYYREARDGQLLEEGITEAGALSSWIAAATSYSVHGMPMLPFYIYYSMFGFQRVGDLIWAAADQRARGLPDRRDGGRTTLGGEGLQHQDGSSHLVASTIPNCRAYDPAFAYEVAVIVDRRHARMMVERQRDVFYYITVMNENYAHPSAPGGNLDDASLRAGILKGIYRLSSDRADSAQVQLLGSGAILGEVIAAQMLLAEDWNIDAAVWSVTSFTELHRDGAASERIARLGDEADEPFVTSALASTQGPVIAATDYVRAVPELIRAYVPRRYVTLGTDGFGRSDTRQSLREFFEVDRASIVIAALKALADEGVVDVAVVKRAREQYGKVVVDAPWAR